MKKRTPPKKPAAPDKRSPLERKWQKWWLGLDASVRDVLGPAFGFTGDPAPKKLASLAKLSSLDLYEAGLVDLTPLVGLTNLRKLDVYGNVFTDLTPLTKLTKLEFLRIGNCTEITDISALAKLPNLTQLDVSSTSISDLSPLERLKNLRYLLAEGLAHIDDLDEQLAAVAKKLPKCRISTAD